MQTAWRGDRAQWLELCRQLVDSALLHASSDGATITLPGEPSRHGARFDGLEGYSRVLLTYAFGASAEDSPFGPEHGDRLRGGLVAGLAGERGTRRWPEAEAKGHSIVDAGYIALALCVLPEDFAALLTADERQRLVAWLREHALAEAPANNWMLFRVSIAAALRRLDPTRASDTELDAAVADTHAAMESWFDPETGWYTDGDARTVDYYNAFELHAVPALLAYLDGDHVEVSRQRRRLATFLPSFRELFDAEGLPVYAGRSLVYRFAIATPLALGVLLEVGDEPPGRTRERINATVGAFLKRGAREADGTLLPGWFEAHRELAQDYTGPSGAYFAGRVFATLLLPADHPFWSSTSTHEPSIPRRATVLPRQPHWLIDPASDGALVRLINHGSTERVGTITRRRFDDPQYSRLAYSTATAPAEGAGRADRSFTLVVDGQPCARGIIMPHESGERWLSSWSHPRQLTDRPVTSMPGQLKGKDLTTIVMHQLSALVGGWQVDVCVVQGVTRSVQAIAYGGWAVADAEPTVLRRSWWRPRAIVRSSALESELVALRAPRSRFEKVRSTLPQPFGASADFVSLVMPTTAPFRRGRLRTDRTLWMVAATRLDARVESGATVAPRSPRLRGLLRPAAAGGITIGRGPDALRVELDESGLSAKA